MKKVLYLFICILFMAGCGMGNTPTKKVEVFLNKYQMNDTDVIKDLDNTLMSDSTLTESERQEYREFMKKHYQDLKYKIKDEKIDGKKATVEVAVTVRNYADAVNEANEYKVKNADKFNTTNTFASYRLKKLKDVTKEETYTIYFHLRKEGSQWKLDELSDTDESKINGLYGVNDTVILDDTVTNNNSIDNVTDENIITDDKTTTP